MIVGDLKKLLDDYPDDMEIFEKINLKELKHFDYSTSTFTADKYLSLIYDDDKRVLTICDALRFLGAVNDEYYLTFNEMVNLLCTCLDLRLRDYCDGELVSSVGDLKNREDILQELSDSLDTLNKLRG